MAGRPRAKMSVQDRAKQFLPFAALKGLPEALAEKERVVVPKIILTEDMSEELNRKMQQIEPGMIIGVVYFHKDEGDRDGCPVQYQQPGPSGGKYENKL